MSTQFALDLRLARKRSGLSQRDCAHLLDVHPATVCDLERGKRGPSLQQLCTLSVIYGRSFQSLFNEQTEAAKARLRVTLRSLPNAPAQTGGAITRAYHLDRLEERLAASPDSYGEA